MEAKKCFELGCPHEVEYICQCTSPGTYSCELHALKHMKIAGKAHALESIFVESCEETKEAILKVLTEKISKHAKLKKILLSSFNHNLLSSKGNLDELVKILDRSLDELDHFFSKILEVKRISKLEQDPILALLSLQPEDAIEKIKVLIPCQLYWLDNSEDDLRIFSPLKNPYLISLDSYFKVESNAHMALKKSNLLKAIVDNQIKSRFFDEEEIWKYFIQISFAIEAFHSKGYIHRDIKPENILLDENKDVRLADFGLSRYLQASLVEESSSFYSPRMCNGDFQTEESDIWALGCVLYYLCNLEDPFQGNKEKIQNESYIPIKSQYSKELRYFADGCLKKKRNERPTINGIITHEFIVNKAISLGITIPTTSAMSTIYRDLLNSEREKYLKLESKLSEFNNENISQKAEIEHLKEEIEILKNILITKCNEIETFRLKAIEIAEPLEKYKSLNEKQLVEVKMSIRTLIADAEKSKKMLDYSDKDLNVKEPGIAQIEIITAQNLMDKRSKVLKSSNNSAELENEFRRTCYLYQNHSTAHDASVTQAYQDYLTTYHQKTSLFNLSNKEYGRPVNLLIYNTETETQESKLLQAPLSSDTCTTQLPNGKLFCFGSGNSPGIALLIDVNNDCRVEELPSGTACWRSSAIYFNNNVYCFGGYYNGRDLVLSSRFDLDENKWNKLTPLPRADYDCNNIIFNGSILISGVLNRNIWRFSIDNNSFTTIPYDFAQNKRKILINAERLYLIECYEGSMYESEIGCDNAWRRIADSTININPHQTCWQYNKGGIYILLIYYHSEITKYKSLCFKFNLNEKRLNKLFENALQLK